MNKFTSKIIVLVQYFSFSQIIKNIITGVFQQYTLNQSAMLKESRLPGCKKDLLHVYFSSKFVGLSFLIQWNIKVKHFWEEKHKIFNWDSSSIGFHEALTLHFLNQTSKISKNIMLNARKEYESDVLAMQPFHLRNLFHSKHPTYSVLASCVAREALQCSIPNGRPGSSRPMNNILV